MTPGGHRFEVEVVQDDATRMRGLKYRSRLADDQGMLFVHPVAGRHGIWMYECLIPLDIVWLDAARTVVHIEERLQPCSTLPCPGYGPESDVVYILEIGAGMARRSGIRTGQRLEMLFAEHPKPT